MMNRRHFIQSISASCALSMLPLISGCSKDFKIPIRAITHGPKFHWFGYYDKWQFDPTDRYVLGNEVNFEGRSPSRNDIIKVGMVDI